MGDLAHSVVLSPGRVTRLVDSLEREGLVARAPDPASRRASVARLTDAGCEALRAAAVTHHALVRELFTGRLTATQLRHAADLWASILGTPK